MALPSVATIGNAKPVVSGGIKVGPIGTPLPTDPAAALDGGLAPLGYVSDEGLKPDGDRKTNTVKDWAGDVIAQLQEEHSSRFGFTLYAVYDVDVLRAAFGAGNVTQTAAGKITVREDGADLPHQSWVFDVRGDGGKKLRIVVPDGQVTTVKEGKFVPGDLQSFELTVEAFKDANGNKVYRYYDDGGAAAAAVPAAPAVTGYSPAGDVPTDGGLIVLSGSGFADATAVTLDGAALDGDSWEVVSTTRLAVSAPAMAAGTYPLTVTTPAGTSAPFDLTYA